MYNEDFNDWCKNNGIEQPQNNSDLLEREMTIEEFYYLLYDCFEEGKKSFNQL